MKREFVEDKQEDNTTMFSKFHHQTHNSKFQHLPPPQPHHSAADEETGSRSHSHSPDNRRNIVKDDHLSFPQRLPTSDGATIEVVRRPRGRPPGSKNKPKSPVVIQRGLSDPTMSAFVLELPPGVDIIESTTHFCHKRNMGLCVLNGNGIVTNVTLRQPSTTSGATVAFHGHFDILSVSATILPPGGLPAGDGPFALTLAGPQGQVVGGHVVGPLVSAGTIYLIAASFSNPSYHRLHPVETEQDESARDCGVHDSPNTASGEGGSVTPTSGGVPLYSYQPSDVIWPPTTRQPQQSPPPPY